jgi:hypothetical protein
VSLVPGNIRSIPNCHDSYQGDVNIATIVYFHKISDNRMTGSLLHNLQMFTNVCSQNVMPRIVIATTMWSQVDEKAGKQREEELKGDFWKDILEHRCQTARFNNTYHSAWSIIGNLANQGALSFHNRWSIRVCGLTRP